MATMTQNPPKVKANGKAEPTVSLVLAIDHQCYGVTPLRNVRGFRLEKKADGAVYDICQADRGLECSCPDWQARHFEHNTAGCKHVRACVCVGLLEAPRPAPAPPTVIVEAPTPDPEPIPPSPDETDEEACIMWTKTSHLLFAADMEAAGYTVTHYRGRHGYNGPAVRTDCNSQAEIHRALQDVIRATSVYLIWDELGYDLVIYPNGEEQAMATIDYRKLTRAQLIDLLWERRVKGWNFQTSKRGLIARLERADVATELTQLHREQDEYRGD